MTLEELLYGAKDIAQGASNSIAGNVSFPVDMAAALLKALGLPNMDRPIGGSQWMADNGFTAEPKNKLLGMSGEVIGGVLPAASTAKARDIAAILQKAADNSIAPSAGWVRNASGARIPISQAGGINFKNSPPALFHGSAKPIDQFDVGLLGSNTKASDAAAGIHFSDNAADAGFYADMAARNNGLNKGFVGQYDVDMRRPLVVSPFPEDGNARKRLIQNLLDDKLYAADYAKRNGFDGLVYPHGTNVDSGYTAIAFDPSKIKRITD